MPDYNNVPNHCDPRLCIVCRNSRCKYNRNPMFIAELNTPQAINTTTASPNTTELPLETTNIEFLTSTVSNVNNNMLNLNENIKIIYAQIQKLEEGLKTQIAEISKEEVTIMSDVEEVVPEQTFDIVTYDGNLKPEFIVEDGETKMLKKNIFGKEKYVKIKD